MSRLSLDLLRRGVACAACSFLIMTACGGAESTQRPPDAQAAPAAEAKTAAAATPSAPAADSTPGEQPTSVLDLGGPELQ